jgi:hypothetical protein
MKDGTHEYTDAEFYELISRWFCMLSEVDENVIELVPIFSSSNHVATDVNV